MEDEIEDEVVAAYRTARRAIEKARSVRIFISHLIAFILGNLFLGFWNAMTYFVKDSDTLWFFLPLLFWSVGLLIHYVQSMALFDEWWDLDERKIDDRMMG